VPELLQLQRQLLRVLTGRSGAVAKRARPVFAGQDTGSPPRASGTGALVVEVVRGRNAMNRSLPDLRGQIAALVSGTIPLDRFLDWY
jgi:hypothetical protein